MKSRLTAEDRVKIELLVAWAKRQAEISYEARPGYRQPSEIGDVEAVLDDAEDA